MKTKLMIVAFASACILSCSPDTNDTQTIAVDESIPEIANLATFIPNAQFDQTSKGKYVGVFGHHLNPDLHGKIYVNAGNDTRYAALIELVNGEQLRFTGIKQSRTEDLFYFKGKTGSFNIDFTDYNAPAVTNVFMNDADTEAYIVLAKSTRRTDPFVSVGNYVDSSDPTFFGNWDLIGDPATNMLTDEIQVAGLPSEVITQEILTLSISHTGIVTPFVNDTADFDTNAGILCAPGGNMLPTTKPVLMKFVTFGNNTARGVSAGGQTTTVSGVEVTWSLNYVTDFVIFESTITPESYLADDCSPILSGTWSWNGRTGTTTVL